MYKIHQFNWHYRIADQVDNIVLGQQDILQNYNTVLQLGIQAPPGTIFTINAGNNTSIGSAIEIGDTGIYELDLKDSLTYITTLALMVPSYLYATSTKQALEAFDVIVDILYEE